MWKEELLSCLKQKKIFITGATGLIGTNIIYELIAIEKEHRLGMELYALCRTETKAEKRFGKYRKLPFFHLQYQDICSPLELQTEFDYIVHAASNAHPQAYVDNPVGTIETTVLGTDNILKYMCEHSPKARLLYLSSFEVYSRISPDVTSGRVGTVGDVRASYPLSKILAENLCMSYYKQFLLDTVILRPAYVYGPYFDANSSKADAEFFNSALQGKDIVLRSDGKQLRSYCYVKDAVKAIFTVLAKGNAGEAYNVSSEENNCTLFEFAEEIARQAQVNFICQKNAGVTGARAEAVLKADKLKQLGWAADYTLKNGIEETLRIMRREICHLS